jgi:hypothetical protein
MTHRVYDGINTATQIAYHSEHKKHRANVSSAGQPRAALAEGLFSNDVGEPTILKMASRFSVTGATCGMPKMGAKAHNQKW